VERVPLIVGRNPKNAHYLDTKAAKMGHLLISKSAENEGPALLALFLQHIADHIVQNAVVLIVGQLGRGIDTATAINHFLRPSARVRVTGTVAPGCRPAGC
jgi:GTP cyclohydrolase II